MEHRCCSRVPVALDVLIYMQGLPIMPARTRNLSSGGVFLEMKGHRFSKHKLLEVEFVDSAENELKCYKTQAQVIYCSRDGCGVEFYNISPDIRQNINACLTHPLSHCPSVDGESQPVF